MLHTLCPRQVCCRCIPMKKNLTARFASFSSSSGRIAVAGPCSAICCLCILYEEKNCVNRFALISLHRREETLWPVSMRRIVVHSMKEPDSTVTRSFPS
ncbi:hypothetical protein AVEN_1158-1 [Araneus ventricosus]|uniref:Uncharacterized protein n=1 Tax=Araneus ventricosus TaxID=182803 RepID=A0A4Y2KQS4_ARAVE|nr:hypothetical protein AVEN_1158-1 [Araneus ventricosus]